MTGWLIAVHVKKAIFAPKFSRQILKLTTKTKTVETAVGDAAAGDAADAAEDDEDEEDGNNVADTN